MLIFNLNTQAQFGNPYKYTKVYLKNGDKLRGNTKPKKKGLKFKKFSVKPFYINYEDIKYIEQRIDVKSKRFYFFKTNHDNDYVKVEELKKGKNLSLYAHIYNTNTAVAGGFSVNETVVSYYLRKRNNTKLIFIGPYSPLGNNLKDKVLRYFSDCPELIEKIDNKDFRMRDGLEPIFEFYVKNCEN